MKNEVEIMGRFKMKTVQKIIDQFGDMDEWAGGHIKIPNDPYMPLTIEYLGKGPYNGDLLAISHTYVQNGDLMRDPEIVFLVTDLGWTPISFRNDSVGVYQESLIIEYGEIRYVRHKLVRELRSFARLWDRNIRSQGYFEAATGRQS
jgi:hypothetical protein